MFLFQMAPAVEYLLHSYPEYVTVDSFSHGKCGGKGKDIYRPVNEIFFLWEYEIN